MLWYGRSTLEQDAIEGIAAKRDKRMVALPGGGGVEILNVLLVGTDDPGSSPRGSARGWRRTSARGGGRTR